jgi:hypothetical protein
MMEGLRGSEATGGKKHEEAKKAEKDVDAKVWERTDDYSFAIWM